jgi:hypothetical protein
VSALLQGLRSPGKIEGVLVAAAAIVVAAALRQIPAVPRSPDLITLRFIADELLRIQSGGPSLIGRMLPTLLYLLGVGLLAPALVVTMRPRGQSRRSSVRTTALVAAVAASLSASLPSIDSVTLAVLELPGMVIGALLVYLLTRVTVSLASRLM